MPVDLRTHEPEDGIDIAPGTNKAKIIKLLYGNPMLGYKPSEIRDRIDIPMGSVTTTLLRLQEDSYIGKTADGYYHALEARDDLRRVATGLQAEELTDSYVDGDLSPEDAEQTKSRAEQLRDASTITQSESEIENEIDTLEDELNGKQSK